MKRLLNLKFNKIKRDNSESMRDERIYLASSMDADFRESIIGAAQILRETFRDVYVPMEHVIKNAWDYPNNEWGLMVFQNDLSAIDDCDYVVFLNYGRERTTAGCSWEAGYAFASGKKVFVVDIPHPHLHEPDPEYKVPQFITSLMIENGRYATINGLDGLRNYDWEKLKKTRTKYEQK